MIFQRKIQIWPKVLVKKVTMQCTKIKTHTDACYPCKINKTNQFSPILVTSIHKTDFFLIIEIYMCPKRVTKPELKIIVEIFGPKNQFKYFWKVETQAET